MGSEAENLRVHGAMRKALAKFYQELVARAPANGIEMASELRQQPVYHIAEFLYLWRAFGIASREQMEAYIKMHNDQVRALVADRKRMALFGFAPSRLAKALFDESNTSKFIAHYLNFDHSFDQSDLARLLVEVTAPETTRKAIVVLSNAGYLIRSSGLLNAVVVRSSGLLEDVFASHLSEFRADLAVPPPD